VIHQSVSVVLQCGAGAWLHGLAIAEISADLREAIAHQRRVRDHALYKSTVTVTFTLCRFFLKHAVGKSS